MGVGGRQVVVVFAASEHAAALAAGVFNKCGRGGR
jgi:hypothetical protein